MFRHSDAGAADRIEHIALGANIYRNWGSPWKPLSHPACPL